MADKRVKGAAAASAAGTSGWIGPSGAMSYTIPKKKPAQVAKQSLLRAVTATAKDASVAREYEEVESVVNRHFYHTASSQHFKIINCQVVHNPPLTAKFEKRRQQMRNSSDYSTQQSNISYGFLLVQTQDEANKIAKDGLCTGNMLGALLGVSSKGVYLSKFSDILSGSALVDGAGGIIIVFKVLRGKHKQVLAGSSGELEPTFGYDSHIPSRSLTAADKLTPGENFTLSQIYLYEYEDISPKTHPGNVCPIAVVTMRYQDKESAGYSRKHGGDTVTWSGCLRLSPTHPETTLPDVKLLSTYSRMKPFGLHKNLQIKQLIPLEQMFEWKPIKSLSSSSRQGSLFKRREVKLESQQYANYWRLTSGYPTNPTKPVFRSSSNINFETLVQKMRDTKLAGVGFLRGGTSIVVFPSGELSSQLGIPSFTDFTRSSLHCVSVSYRSSVTGLGFTGINKYDDKEALPSLSSALRVDAKLMAHFAQLHTTPTVISTNVIPGQSPDVVIMDENYQKSVTEQSSSESSIQLPSKPETEEAVKTEESAEPLEPMDLDSSQDTSTNKNSLSDEQHHEEKGNEIAKKPEDTPADKSSGFWGKLNASRDPRLRRRLEAQQKANALPQPKESDNNDSASSIGTLFSMGSASEVVRDDATDVTYHSSSTIHIDINSIDQDLDTPASPSPTPCDSTTLEQSAEIVVPLQAPAEDLMVKHLKRPSFIPETKISSPVHGTWKPMVKRKGCPGEDSTAKIAKIGETQPSSSQAKEGSIQEVVKQLCALGELSTYSEPSEITTSKPHSIEVRSKAKPEPDSPSPQSPSPSPTPSEEAAVEAEFLASSTIADAPASPLSTGIDVDLRSSRSSVKEIPVIALEEPTHHSDEASASRKRRNSELDQVIQTLSSFDHGREQVDTRGSSLFISDSVCAAGLRRSGRKSRAKLRRQKKCASRKTYAASPPPPPATAIRSKVFIIPPETRMVESKEKFDTTKAMRNVKNWIDSHDFDFILQEPNAENANSLDENVTEMENVAEEIPLDEELVDFISLNKKEKEKIKQQQLLQRTQKKELVQLNKSHNRESDGENRFSQWVEWSEGSILEADYCSQQRKRMKSVQEKLDATEKLFKDRKHTFFGFSDDGIENHSLSLLEERTRKKVNVETKSKKRVHFFDETVQITVEDQDERISETPDTEENKKRQNTLTVTEKDVNPRDGLQLNDKKNVFASVESLSQQEVTAIKELDKDDIVQMQRLLDDAVGYTFQPVSPDSLSGVDDASVIEAVISEVLPNKLTTPMIHSCPATDFVIVDDMGLVPEQKCIEKYMESGFREREKCNPGTDVFTAAGHGDVSVPNPAHTSSASENTTKCSNLQDILSLTASIEENKNSLQRYEESEDEVKFPQPYTTLNATLKTITKTSTAGKTKKFSENDPAQELLTNTATDILSEFYSNSAEVSETTTKDDMVKNQLIEALRCARVEQGQILEESLSSLAQTCCVDVALNLVNVMEEYASTWSKKGQLRTFVGTRAKENWMETEVDTVKNDFADFAKGVNSILKKHWVEFSDQLSWTHSIGSQPSTHRVTEYGDVQLETESESSQHSGSENGHPELVALAGIGENHWNSDEQYVRQSSKNEKLDCSTLDDSHDEYDTNQDTMIPTEKDPESTRKKNESEGVLPESYLTAILNALSEENFQDFMDHSERLLAAIASHDNEVNHEQLVFHGLGLSNHVPKQENNFLSVNRLIHSMIYRQLKTFRSDVNAKILNAKSPPENRESYLTPIGGSDQSHDSISITKKKNEIHEPDWMSKLVKRLNERFRHDIRKLLKGSILPKHLHQKSDDEESITFEFENKVFYQWRHRLPDGPQRNYGTVLPITEIPEGWKQEKHGAELDTKDILCTQQKKDDRIQTSPDSPPTLEEASTSEPVAIDLSDDLSLQLPNVIPQIGILIPDDVIFNRANTDDVRKILEAFAHWKEKGTAEWVVKLHSQVVLGLASAKKSLDQNSLTYHRLSSILRNLTEFRRTGVVELLANHVCDANTRVPGEYLPCVKGLKEGTPGNNVCTVFLSNLDRNSKWGQGFIREGLFVMNIELFIESFIKENSSYRLS